MYVSIIFFAVENLFKLTFSVLNLFPKQLESKNRIMNCCHIIHFNILNKNVRLYTYSSTFIQS